MESNNSLHLDQPQFDLWNQHGNDPTYGAFDVPATSIYDTVLNGFQLPALPDFTWELPEIGDEPLVQTFFEGPKRCDCCINWVEKQPQEIPIKTQEKYQKAAIRVYKCKDHRGHDANGPKPSVVGGLPTTITITYIEIQSPIIRREIGPILKEGGLETLDAETIKIFRPFRELYFAHTRITDILKNQMDGSKEKEHMHVLVDVMGEIFLDVMPEVSALHAEKKITEKYLWTLFPKGIVAYSHRDGEDRLYQILCVLGSSVECRCLTSNGTIFGWQKIKIGISPFLGIQKISNLEIYPVGFHEDKGLEKRLGHRGRRVLEYQDIVHCQHNVSSSFNNTTYERVVIDAFGYAKYSSSHVVVEELEDKREGKSTRDKNVTEAKHPRSKLRPDQRPSAEQQNNNKARMQQEEQWLPLISPMLPGFSFNKGRWQHFCVDNLEPILWNTEALSRLVFPEEHKDLLLSFVTNYGQSITHSEDIINGKGQGLVVLLSGPPGTGKTLTVEAISEKAKRPLYRPGRRGSLPSSLAETLSEASNYAKEYGAILLLDEADIFLGRRSAEYSDRNDIVAEMLQELDYYVGIIFLTTNLLGDIDNAFLSRIHMHFKYPALSASSRLKIWRDVIYRKPETSHGEGESKNQNHPQVDVSDEDLNMLTSWELNGREIKNVVKVGRLWCLYNQYPLTRSRLETVITTTAPSVAMGDSLTNTEALPRKRARIE